MMVGCWALGIGTFSKERNLVFESKVLSLRLLILQGCALFWNLQGRAPIGPVRIQLRLTNLQQ